MKKDINYYTNLNYAILVKKVQPEDGNGWFAYYKDFQGVMRDGKSKDEALQAVKEAFKAYIAIALQNNDTIFEPNSFEISESELTINIKEKNELSQILKQDSFIKKEDFVKKHKLS